MNTISSSDPPVSEAGDLNEAPPDLTGLRVLVANEFDRPIGGIEEYLRTIVPGLAGAGATVGFITPSLQYAHGLGFTGVDRVEYVARRLSGVAGLMADARAWRPDVAYVHGLVDPADESALLASVPSILFRHDYRGSCPSGYKRFGSPIPAPCSRSLGAGCLTRWYPRRCGGLNPRTAAMQFLRERHRREFSRQAAAVAVASQHMAEDLRRNGTPADTLSVLPYPATSPRDPVAPEPRPLTGRILFVGRITDLKGWRYLVPAIALAQETLARTLSLVVAGSGPDEREFRALANSHRLDAEFLGWITPERRIDEMRMADVLAVPSIWPEPFGIVGIEAACVGLPAVAFDVGGIRDWLTHNVSGALASGDPPTVRGLAHALTVVLATAETRHTFATGAWTHASRFTVANHLRQLSALLRSVRTTPTGRPT